MSAKIGIYRLSYECGTSDRCAEVERTEENGYPAKDDSRSTAQAPRDYIQRDENPWILCD